MSQPHFIIEIKNMQAVTFLFVRFDGIQELADPVGRRRSRSSKRRA